MSKNTVAQAFVEYGSRLLGFIRSRVRAVEDAEKTGVPVNTLLSRKHYAVERLREKLREIYDDFLS